MATALITGITGQDGSYLAEFLLAKGYRVVGVRRRGFTDGAENVAPFASRVELLDADLLDQQSLIAAVETAKPDEVYNLAAQSSVAASWKEPVATAEMTGLGVTRLLEAVRLAAPSARFYQAGSSEVFGNAVESPQRETTPFRPRNPYGAAKAYAHWITASYRDAHQLFAVSGILFNHESPRRGTEFVTRRVTDAAARIKLGTQKELVLGTLDARRDWGFAADYAESMWMMLQQPEPRDFVIGTGIAHSVRDLCRIAFARAGLDFNDHVRVDAAQARKADDALLVADPSAARRDLRWEARTSFADLVGLMVDADLARHASLAR